MTLAGILSVPGRRRARRGRPVPRVHGRWYRHPSRGRADRPGHAGNGLVVEANHTFDDCPPLDVLLVAGGSSGSETAGRRVEQRNEPTIAFIRERARDAQLTASVCTGAFLLAEAGVLSGRRANTHWMYRDELRELMSARGEPFDLVPG